MSKGNAGSFSVPGRPAYIGVENGISNGNNGILDAADGTNNVSATYALYTDGSTKTVTIISNGPNGYPGRQH